MSKCLHKAGVGPSPQESPTCGRQGPRPAFCPPAPARFPGLSGVHEFRPNITVRLETWTTSERRSFPRPLWGVPWPLSSWNPCILLKPTYPSILPLLQGRLFPGDPVPWGAGSQSTESISQPARMVFGTACPASVSHSGDPCFEWVGVAGPCGHRSSLPTLGNA